MTIRVLAAAAAMLAPLGVLGGLAPVANADAGDAQFLSALHSEGITDHFSSTHAIEAGHTVCDKLNDGLTPTEVANDVVESSSMPAYHAGYFVSVSIKAYCPQFTPEAPTPNNG